MGEIEASTIDERKATLVRAVERGAAVLDRYLVVIRRRPDGSWRYATDMWNSDAG
jgi:ketosteroid isomerase-like protein